MKVMSAPQLPLSQVGKISLRFNWEHVGYNIPWLLVQHLAFPTLSFSLERETRWEKQTKVELSHPSASLALVFSEEFLQGPTQN